MDVPWEVEPTPWKRSTLTTKASTLHAVRMANGQYRVEILLSAEQLKRVSEELT